MHLKSSNVCIITRSSVASPLFKGLATKRTTVKWTTAPLITLKSQSRYNQKEKQMNICNFLMERLSQKRTRQPRKAKRVVSGHGSLTSGFQGNITVRKRHSRCNQFISFTRLTFTSILSYKKEKRNELTLMKNENILFNFFVPLVFTCMLVFIPCSLVILFIFHCFSYKNSLITGCPDYFSRLSRELCPFIDNISADIRNKRTCIALHGDISVSRQ